MISGSPEFNGLMRVRFSAQYHSLSESLARKLGGLVNFCTFFLGSSAVIAAAADRKWIGVASGLVIAVLSAFDIVYASADKISENRKLFQRYMDLEAEILRTPPPAAEIDAKLAEIEKDSSPPSTQLRKLAQRRTLVAHGMDRDAEEPALDPDLFGVLLARIL